MITRFSPDLVSQKICYLFITYSLLPNCIVLYRCNHVIKKNLLRILRENIINSHDVTKRVPFTKSLIPHRLPFDRLPFNYPLFMCLG